MRYYLVVALLALTVLFTACDSSTSNSDNTPDVNIEDLQVDPNFDYSTKREVAVNLQVMDFTNNPLEQIYLEIIADFVSKEGGTEEMVIFKGMTDNSGQLTGKVFLPAYISEASVRGFMETKVVDIAGNSINCTFGGSYNRLTRGSRSDFTVGQTAFAWVDSTMSEQGVPSDIQRGSVSSELIRTINSKLPEGRRVRDRYIDTAMESEVVINEDNTVVWVKFVYEGAGYQNALGYYTYTTGSAPTVPSNLTKTIIFPNVSRPGSGGDLIPGDSLYIGQFDAGQTVGFFIAQDAWTANQTNPVDDTAQMIYTNPAWNPQSVIEYQRHNVLLWDEESQSLILGFEDILRPGGDQDFNDVLFQVKAVPPSSDEYAIFNPEDENDDTDGDSVPDVLDDFPDDGTRAYITSYFGTHVFEDLWPSKGDYDFNDVVIYYDIKQISNASSQLLAIIPEYHLQASGASYTDGFAVEFPFDGSGLTFTAMSGSPSPISGLQKYVVKVFDSTHEVFNTNGMFNTENDEPYLDPAGKEVKFAIQFDNPVESSLFEYGVPYNPFIFVKSLNYPELLQEEIEVHFADMPPTAMVADSLFRTKHDDSDAAQGRYYKTSTNLPWALDLVGIWWNYPEERASITGAYIYFKDWAESNGANHPDWYLPHEGNVDPTLLYTPDILP